MRYFLVFIIFVLNLFLVGCAKNVVVSRTMPPSSEVLDPGQATKLWATVLEANVDRQGKIDFAGVAETPYPLRSYVNYIANVSPENRPEQFAGEGARMAYYLNSYNALAMYGVVHLEIERGFQSLWARADFFKLQRYQVGGRWISLLDYENKVIRPLGDPRVHFALNCMVKGCPRLPQTPLRASDLDQQLDQAAKEFLNDPRNVQVENDSKRVRLSEILKFYTEDFVNPQVESSLIDYVNRYRHPPIPNHFSVEFIPYDWSLNKK